MCGRERSREWNKRWRILRERKSRSRASVCAGEGTGHAQPAPCNAVRDSLATVAAVCRRKHRGQRTLGPLHLEGVHAALPHSHLLTGCPVEDALTCLCTRQCGSAACWQRPRSAPHAQSGTPLHALSVLLAPPGIVALIRCAVVSSVGVRKAAAAAVRDAAAQLCAQLRAWQPGQYTCASRRSEQA